MDKALFSPEMVIYIEGEDGAVAHVFEHQSDGNAFIYTIKNVDVINVIDLTGEVIWHRAAKQKTAPGT